LDRDAANEAQLAATESGDDATGQQATVEQMQAEIGEARDLLLRAQADLDNYRKRARRELEDEVRYANMPLLRDLLPVVDNIGRATAAAEKAEPTAESAKLLEGFKLVAKQLDDVLARHHCVRIAALGQPFDPNLHQAILQQPSREVPPGTVVTVAQEGYQLHDRVVRPAQVIVSTAAD
jgi:molecular chaperone GrpE